MQVHAHRQICALVHTLGVAMPPQGDGPSTAWHWFDIPVFVPRCIIDRECTCAQRAGFHDQIACDCRGLGGFNLTHHTIFEHEAEVLPTLKHAEKKQDARCLACCACQRSRYHQSESLSRRAELVDGYLSSERMGSVLNVAFEDYPLASSGPSPE